MHTKKVACGLHFVVGFSNHGKKGVNQVEKVPRRCPKAILNTLTVVFFTNLHEMQVPGDLVRLRAPPQAAQEHPRRASRDPLEIPKGPFFFRNLLPVQAPCNLLKKTP